MTEGFSTDLIQTPRSEISEEPARARVEHHLGSIMEQASQTEGRDWAYYYMAT